MYTFTVADVGDIDLDRIVQENRAVGVDATVIPLQREGDFAVVLSSELLKRFEAQDEIVVCGEPLSPRWGKVLMCVSHLRGELVSSSTSRVGWMTRGRCITALGTSVAQIEDELRFALSYEREIEVKVLQFRPPKLGRLE